MRDIWFVFRNFGVIATVQFVKDTVARLNRKPTIDELYAQFRKEREKYKKESDPRLN